MVEVGRGPLAEQGDQLRVQGDVAVVAQLAERDPQPVVAADLHDGVGLEIGEFAGAHAGAGEQLDNEAVAWVGAGAGGGHELRGVLVVEEAGQRFGLLRDVAVDHRVAGRGVGPVPLDDPLEERADHPQPLAMRLR